jgi:hypothetical protein
MKIYMVWIHCRGGGVFVAAHNEQEASEIYVNSFARSASPERKQEIIGMTTAEEIQIPDKPCILPIGIEEE